MAASPDVPWPTATDARSLRVRGVVQGVGFRPFVFRLAEAHDLRGWVLNDGDGVRIHVEGAPDALEAFVEEVALSAPPAARIAEITVQAVPPQGVATFEIRHSALSGPPTVRISPDLAVCDACLAELFDPSDRRHAYPYINCTNCGPRYSIIRGLPYDRPLTTMRDWPMCARCASEYQAPRDRRFHAQPTACPQCGPGYVLKGREAARERSPEAIGTAAIVEAARRLREGQILAVKGLGGYHLACDACNVQAVTALRERKYRKEKPFAVMARDVAAARGVIQLQPAAAALLQSPARPIVLAQSRLVLPGVAPDNPDLGVMLPYTPLHHLLFAAGAPDVLVMTSGNVSSEPIAYEDDDAFERLSALADGFLVGERPIARRLDDSVVRLGVFGPTVLRRARGYTPAVVARLPIASPVLAVGADLKNSITLVVDGQAVVSQYVGDLEHYPAYEAFTHTIDDLLSMYDVNRRDLLVVHDRHPQYASTAQALTLDAARVLSVQHHRAHIASVVAERGAFDTPVLGIAFDGTGYGDDGTIWGGEFFVGSVRKGLERVANLRPAVLPGGDAAARHPVQAAAGFLAALDSSVDLTAPPFGFPDRYRQARRLIDSGIRVFATTSVGRLFDTVAAIAGFTRPVTFEGQAAIWLEHLARQAAGAPAYPCVFTGSELDFRPALAAAVAARSAGVDPAIIARAFHRGLASGLADAVASLRQRRALSVVVLSGGVFQNELLLADVKELLDGQGVEVWTNHEVPPNDGGISLGQAALAVGASGEVLDGT